MNFDANTRGVIQLKSKKYGKSVYGTDLRYFSSKKQCKLLIIAGIHGEEPETTFFLSRSMRAFKENFQHIAFVLCANPDGITLGTRGNANGVDLNRNFKTKNWSSEKVFSRSILEASRDTILSPGNTAESELETQSLVKLIKEINPQIILSIHAPIGCIDAPQQTDYVKKLQDVFGLPWVSQIGYATPGSLGTWCTEQKIDCITLELPRMAPEILYERFGSNFATFLAETDNAL